MRFSPRWLTPNSTPLDATPYLEGSIVALALAAEDVASFNTHYSPAITTALSAASDVVASVKANSDIVDPGRVEVSGKLLTINLAGLSLPDTFIIEVTRDTDLTYSLLYGDLPPGLSLRADGIVHGTIGNVVGDDTIVYTFSCRATNGALVQDRQFTIRVEPEDKPFSWLTSDLPVPETDDALEIEYHPFGTFRRLELFRANITGRNSDLETPQIEMRPTGLSGSFIEGLPSGLAVSDTVIKGTILQSAASGRYLAAVGFVGQLTPILYLEIIVEDGTAVDVYSPSIIEWKTSPTLDSMIETYPSTLSVEATSAQPVSYLFAPNSRPLPGGLTLNATTGQIVGYATHVTKETNYSFTIRAKTATAYSDRTFSVTVHNRYNTAVTLDVRLQVRTTDRKAMAGIRELIPAANIYRDGDSNFGVQTEPSVYIIKGLSGSSMEAALGEDNNQPFGSDYHGQFDVLLGRHVVAVARKENGDILYEPVYRALIDVNANAGGFVFNTDLAIEDKVLYPQSGDEPTYIYPKSIRNARLDFVKDIGFATNDPALKKLTGPTGVEALPLWMTSEQVVGSPASVLGFVAAMVIVYAKPGYGNSIAATLNACATLPPRGREMTFARLFAYEQVNRIGTTMDGQSLTFDGGTTFFDPM